MTHDVISEFSRLVAADPSAGHSRAFSIEATDQERNALAQRFGLISVQVLVCDGTLIPGTDHLTIGLEARLRAEVVQTCVVSLDPVTQHIDVEFDRVFAANVEEAMVDNEKGGREIFLSLETDDTPEPIVGGNIDLGEIVAEQLALELDPFPRTSEAIAPKVASVDEHAGSTLDSGNPFSALAVVKAKLKKDGG